MEFKTESITRKGSSHDTNEDSYIVKEDYMIIADGMGGESCGEIASQIAIKVISSILDSQLINTSTEQDIKELSLHAIKKADAEILEYEKSNPESFGMGTTIVLIFKKNNKGYVSWCGDSRCYLFTGQLHAITKDHSYVQELIDANQLTIEESYTHPDNNLITRYVGGGENACIPDFVSFDFNDDSTIILCSDGLSGYCRDEEIQKEITSNRLDNLPLRLLNMAVKNGSDDDITIITMSPLKERHRSLFGWFRRNKK